MRRLGKKKRWKIENKNKSVKVKRLNNWIKNKKIKNTQRIKNAEINKDCQFANVHYTERLLCFVTLRARAEQTKTENKYIKVKIYWQKMAENSYVFSFFKQVVMATIELRKYNPCGWALGKKKWKITILSCLNPNTSLIWFQYMHPPSCVLR